MSKATHICALLGRDVGQVLALDDVEIPGETCYTARSLEKCIYRKLMELKRVGTKQNGAIKCLPRRYLGIIAAVVGVVG